VSGRGRPLRVLQVGWGFHPWRVGGLILYANDLMDDLVARGHELTYFFAGRHYPFLTRRFLWRWRERGIAMRELVNPPIVPGLERGTRRPDLELSEPWIESRFERTLRSARPDVVHVQELQGLPSSLLDLAREAGVPVVMTLHDYGTLCATLRLVDADGLVCTRTEVGADCVARNAEAPLDPRLVRRETVEFEIRRLRHRLNRLRLPQLSESAEDWIRSRSGAAEERMQAMYRELPRPEPALAPAFQRRREVNLERMARVDRLVAQSRRVAEVHQALGVPGERMRVMTAMARHIERLTPRRLEAPPEKLTFVSLGGCATRSKGSHVIEEALRALRAAGAEGRFRLRVYGHIDPAVAPTLEGFEDVELPFTYPRDRLDSMLDDADVGLMPSIWEEALGYTGLEMLAKGIPLIANPLGGIADYVVEGRTGWVNRSCTGAGMAELMLELIEDPRRVVEMHAGTVAARDDILIPWDGHVDAIESTYRELAA
jgi:glycosyltransferase involved in cell wall biosynthesis